MNTECVRKARLERSSSRQQSACQMDTLSSSCDKLFILLQLTLRSFDRSIARPLERSIARSLDRSIARSRGRSIPRSLALPLGRSAALEARSLDRSDAGSLNYSLLYKISLSFNSHEKQFGSGRLFGSLAISQN